MYIMYLPTVTSCYTTKWIKLLTYFCAVLLLVILIFRTPITLLIITGHINIFVNTCTSSKNRTLFTFLPTHVWLTKSIKITKMKICFHDVLHNYPVLPWLLPAGIYTFLISDHTYSWANIWGWELHRSYINYEKKAEI